MHTRAIEAYKRTLELLQEQRDVLVGTLLGDGHLETQDHGRTYRLKIEHGLGQRSYVEWLYDVFRPWVLTPPQEKEQPWRDRVDRKVWFQTVSHPALRFYGQQFYRSRRKVVSKIIHHMLTPLALAVWFMDDGSVKSSHHRALLLNTQAFDRNDLERVRGALRERFSITTTLRRQREGFQIQISSPDVEVFVGIIEPFVLPSLRYKFGRLRNNMPKR